MRPVLILAVLQDPGAIKGNGAHSYNHNLLPLFLGICMNPKFYVPTMIFNKGIICCAFQVVGLIAIWMCSSICSVWSVCTYSITFSRAFQLSLKIIWNVNSPQRAKGNKTNKPDCYWDFFIEWKIWNTKEFLWKSWNFWEVSAIFGKGDLKVVFLSK